MLTPNFLLHITEGAEAIANLLHTEILKAIVRRIMARLNNNDDYLLTATDKWQIRTLQEAGFLMEDIQKQISIRTGQELSEIQKAFVSAGIESLKYDDKVYKKAGLNPKPLNQSPHLTRVLERNFEQTAGTWNNITRTTADAAQQQFIQTCDRALNLANSGGMTMQQAVMDAIDDLARNGIKSVNYPTGYKNTMEVATLRAVRTGINQTAAQISLKRMQEMDWDIILVSSHLGARNVDIAGIPYANHEKWQGKFYSRTGRDPRFPDFVSSTGYGTGEGLCGWNCRHSFGSGDGVHNNFEQFDTEDNKERYYNEQQQRALERRIREYKRRLEVYKEALKQDSNNEILKKKFDATKKRLVDFNTEYRAFCKDNGLRPLEDRLKTGEYMNPKIAASVIDKTREQAKNVKALENIGVNTGAKPKYDVPCARDILHEWKERKDQSQPVDIIIDKTIMYEGKEYPIGKTGDVTVVSDHKPREIEVAQLIANKYGGKMHVRPRITNPQRVSCADLKYNGILYDIKELKEGESANSVFKAAYHAKEQANRVIIDIANRKPTLTDEKIAEGLNTIFWSSYTKFVEMVIVVDKDSVLNILVRK